MIFSNRTLHLLETICRSYIIDCKPETSKLHIEVLSSLISELENRVRVIRNKRDKDKTLMLILKLKTIKLTYRSNKKLHKKKSRDCIKELLKKKIITRNEHQRGTALQEVLYNIYRSIFYKSLNWEIYTDRNLSGSNNTLFNGVRQDYWNLYKIWIDRCSREEVYAVECVLLDNEFFPVFQGQFKSGIKKWPTTKSSE